MATQSQINKNIEALKQKGAPQEVLDQYLSLAKKEQTGVDKVKDVGKEIVRGVTGSLVAPVAMLSEGVRGLTGTEQSGTEKKLSDFAFEGTKLGTRERGGVALERALDSTALISAPGSGFKNIAKYGAKYGAGYGVTNSLQDKEFSTSKLLTDALVGGAIGTIAGVTLYGAGKALKFGAEETKKGVNYFADEFKNYQKNVQKFSNYVNDDSILKRGMDSVADLAMDINPHLAQQMRENPSVRSEIQSQVTSGSKPNEMAVKLFNEMRDAVIQIDDDISKNFSKVQDEVLGDLGEKQTDILSNYFVSHLKQFDPNIQVVDGIKGKVIKFSPDSQLSKPDQNAIIKMFNDEFVNRPNNIKSLVSVARIVDRGLPEESTSRNLINFKKTLGGNLRDTAKNLINDPRWDKINTDYETTADFLRQVEPLIGSLKNYPNVVKLDSILTQLGRAYRVDKNARQGIITEIEKRSGKKFADALTANEILRDFTKNKGIKDSKNVFSAILRIVDPAKNSVFASTVTGKTPFNSIAKATSNTANSIGKTVGGRINDTAKVLLYGAQNPNLTKGVRMLYLLLAKELLFPVSSNIK